MVDGYGGGGVVQVAGIVLGGLVVDGIVLTVDGIGFAADGIGLAVHGII